MKKLLTLLLILISLVSMAQDGVTQSGAFDADSFMLSGETMYLDHLLLSRADSGKWAKHMGDYVTWEYFTPGTSGYASNIYLSDSASSTVGSYKKLSYINDALTATQNIVLNNNELLIKTYLYDTPIGVTMIDAGTWMAHFYAKVSSPVLGVTRFKFEVFTRTAAGVEDTLFSAYSNQISNTNYAYTEEIQAIADKFIVNSNDKLGVRIYGTTTSSANVTLYYQTGDNTATHFSTPLKMRHSQLRIEDWNDAGHTGTPGKLAAFDENGEPITITESDPLFGASVSHSITATDTNSWSNDFHSITSATILPIDLGLEYYFRDRYNQTVGTLTLSTNKTGSSAGLFGVSDWNLLQEWANSVAYNITSTDTTRWGQSGSSYIATSPLHITSNNISMTEASSSLSGWISATNYNRIQSAYNGRVASASSPIIYNGGTNNLSLASTALTTIDFPDNTYDFLLFYDYSANSWKKTYTKTVNGNSIYGTGDITIAASMVYPGAGIPISNGSSWGTSITDNHLNWDAGYNYRLLSASGSGALTLSLSSNALTGSISAATSSAAGTMSATDKGKIDDYRDITPQSITTSASCSTFCNFYTTASSNKTITFSNPANGVSGNIRITYSSAAVITFACSGYTIMIADNIYNGTTGQVLSKSSGDAVYSYYIDSNNSKIYINGTQSYH